MVNWDGKKRQKPKHELRARRLATSAICSVSMSQGKFYTANQAVCTPFLNLIPEICVNEFHDTNQAHAFPNPMTTHTVKIYRHGPMLNIHSAVLVYQASKPFEDRCMEWDLGAPQYNFLKYFCCRFESQKEFPRPSNLWDFIDSCLPAKQAKDKGSRPRPPAWNVYWFILAATHP